MNLKVLAVGRLKDAGLEAMCQTYAKRLRPTMPIDIVEVRNLKALRDALQRIPHPHVLLDERGDLMSTEAFASWLGQLREAGHRSCTFMVGDAHGFETSDREAADRVLSLSPMTLPHRLARVVLVEQLYRAACVLQGHPYHHA